MLKEDGTKCDKNTNGMKGRKKDILKEEIKERQMKMWRKYNGKNASKGNKERRTKVKAEKGWNERRLEGKA